MIENTDENALLLDTLVHDVASQIASNANNGGVPDQLDFLLMHGYTEKDIEEWMEDCRD